MKEKEQWITDVLESMNDSQRAVPKADLFAKIEAQIDELPTTQITRRAKVISIRRWQLAAAVALLLLVNIFTLYQSVQADNALISKAGYTNDDMGEQLLSNYQIYE